MSTSEDGVVVADEGVPLGDEGATVVVRKVRTRNGERLEIVSEGTDRRIRIDPLALESVSWQDPDELIAELLPDGTAAAPAEPGSTDGDALFSFTLVNEFSEIEVRGARAGSEEFLELVAPRVGHRIQLPPAVLDAIAARDTHLFSTFLELPYGPEDHDA